jgi:hypothetical protein
VRDPYIFEFLGLKPRDVMSESHLEEQLLDHLQELERAGSRQAARLSFLDELAAFG